MNELGSVLRQILEPAVAAGQIPGAVAIAGTTDDACDPVVLGVRKLGGPATTADTRYDLASLSKVVATLPAVLRLISDGTLNLEDRIGRYFSNAGWLQSPSLADVPVRALLTHGSGLPAWEPIFARASQRLTGFAAVLQSPLPHPPGRVVYSDLGFMLLGMLVERISGQRLDAFVRERIFAPLGLEQLGYGPLRDTPVAATEDCGWRMRLLEGEVHDENAWSLEGVAGHAGLFGTGHELARYARAWLRADPILGDRRLLSAAVRRQTGEGEPARGLGWVLADGGGARQRGEVSEPEADWRGARGYGHTGFTGTSLWIDPAAGTFTVLLTNRVHPRREGAATIARLRRDLHRAVAEFAA